MGRALPATDLYSVGITLLECLTHQTPQDLHGEDARRLVAATQVSDDLKRILSRLTAPGLKDRFGSADQVLQDLERLSGGQALVHVSSIEDDIAVREKAEEMELKRASKPALSHYIYYTLVGIAAVAAIVGSIFVFFALSASFEAGFLLAATISGIGLFSNLLLLGRRYTSDAWEPPKRDWLVATATITKLYEGYVLDPNGRSVPFGHLIDYEFPTRRGTHVATRDLRSQDKAKLEIGQKFTVWYPANKPEIHEATDIRHRDFAEMDRLFSHKVEHTPE